MGTPRARRRSPPAVAPLAAVGASAAPASRIACEHLFSAFEKGVVTEAEWKQGERAHRFVREASA